MHKTLTNTIPKVSPKYPQSTGTGGDRRGQACTKVLKGEKTKGRISIVLLALSLLLAACQSAPTIAPAPTATTSPSPSPTAILTATARPTETPTVTPTAEPAWYQPLDPFSGVLKYQYAEVVNKRAKVYASLEDAVGKTGNYGYLPKSPAYVATTTETRDGHTFYFVPVNYGWMDGEDLAALTPSSFTGLLLTREVPFRFGWVLAETQSVNAAGESIRTYQRYQVVHEVSTSVEKPGSIAIGTDEWLPETAVALVSPALPADAGQNTHRFIYANLNTQTLSVFDKDKLVFATLISSGKNSWTFEGRFAILYKVDYSSITPPEWSTSEYYIQGVPYFMSYSGDFGFHGAYWHDNFGIAASHGCINLTPADAKWLYDWAGIGERVIISAGK
jgi:lipoprotein-anchoring transpeptidase ErfK/SrfK